MDGIHGKGELGCSLAERTYVDPLNLIQVILAEGKMSEYRFDTKFFTKASIIVALSHCAELYKALPDASIPLGYMVPVFPLSFRSLSF